MSQAATETLEQIDSPIKSPFIEHLGIQFFRLGASGVEVRLPVTPELLNSAAMVHGGVYATLADCALAAAIHVQMPPGQHVGRRTAVAEGEVWVDDVMQVKASGSFMIVPRAEM